MIDISAGQAASAVLAVLGGAAGAQLIQGLFGWRRDSAETDAARMDAITLFMKDGAPAILNQYKAEVERMGQRVNSLETSLTTLGARLDESEEARYRLGSEVSLFKLQLDRVREEASELRAILAGERADHDAERATWHAERDRLLRQIDERDGRITDLEARVAKLEAELERSAS